MTALREIGASTTPLYGSVRPCAPYSDNYTTLGELKKSRVRLTQTNINFLEHPLFIPARKLLDPSTGTSKAIQKSTRYADGNGFEIQALVDTAKEFKGEKSTMGLPVFFDKKVLGLLSAYMPIFDQDLASAKKLLDADTENVINSVEITNISEFLLEIGSTRGGRSADRLKESLAKWTEIILIFRGDSLTTSKGSAGGIITNVITNNSIKVLDSVTYIQDENGKLSSVKVTFNRDFILCNNDSFSRRFDLSVFFKFQNPTAARLYEILSKSFWGKSGRSPCPRTGAPRWKINLENLMAKLGTHRSRNATQLIKDALTEVNTHDNTYAYRRIFQAGKSGQILVEFTRYKTVNS